MANPIKVIDGSTSDGALIREILETYPAAQTGSGRLSFALDEHGDIVISLSTEDVEPFESAVITSNVSMGLRVILAAGCAFDTRGEA
jgi:hypothetical protein